MPPTKCRILCVEDDADTGFMLARLLGLEYEVRTATSVAQALRLARSERFDCYILDNRFADGTGVELCRELRAADHQTPISFYSGAAYESDKEAGLAAGAQAYVTKPEIDELLATISALLQAEGCKLYSAAGGEHSGGYVGT